MRYRALIVQALDDIGGNPKRPGSRELPTIMVDGARTYHLAFSRGRGGVKEPRHFLLYRKREDDVIEVARVLHDSRNLELHLPKDYRNPTSESS
jgi:toxin ParE1/3/4